MPSELPARADVVVVGAGILGLATAAELLARRPGASVVVLEKEDAPALHQTGRNSCVIHSGVYYAPGSLKARLCTAGRERLIRYCDERGVPYELCGKVVVARDEGERGRLHELHRRATENGVPGLRLVGRAELLELEPHAAGVEALHVPGTGIVDYRLVAAALRAQVEEAGGAVHLGTAVERLDERGRTVVVATGRGEVEAGRAVVCAGLRADALLGRALADGVTIVPFRGSYFALAPAARHLCRTLIYPVPDPQFPFLGVHVSRRPGGEVWAGPNAVVALAREGYGRAELSPRDLWSTVASPGFRRLARRNLRMGAAELYRDLVPRAFAREVATLIPELRPGDLVRAPAGIRPQALRADGTLYDDFLFVETPRVLHVANAPSPAATSSLAIAELIADRALAAAVPPNG